MLLYTNSSESKNVQFYKFVHLNNKVTCTCTRIRTNEGRGDPPPPPPQAAARNRRSDIRVSTEFRRHGIPRNFLTSEVISAQFRRNSAKFLGIPRNFAGIAPEITSVFRGMPKCHFRGHPIWYKRASSPTDIANKCHIFPLLTCPQPWTGVSPPPPTHYTDIVSTTSSLNYQRPKPKKNMVCGTLRIWLQPPPRVDSITFTMGNMVVFIVN